MGDSYIKLDQALKDLIEAYVDLDKEIALKNNDDEDAYSSAMIETLETSIESALEDQDVESKFFANMITFLSDALEQLDPVAFEDAITEGADDEYESDDDDEIDYDDSDDDDSDDDE